MNASRPRPPTIRRKRYLFPRTAAECTGTVLEKKLGKQAKLQLRLIQDWQTIVGDRVAAHCYPVKISFPKGKSTDGHLTLRVKTAYALELAHSQNLLLEKLTMYFGNRMITRISLQQTYG